MINNKFLMTSCLVLTFTLTPAHAQLTQRSADLYKIDHFCEQFRQNIENNFNLITNENVSQQTFIEFSTAARNQLRPGLINFFAELKAMGATKCDLN